MVYHLQLREWCLILAVSLCCRYEEVWSVLHCFNRIHSRRCIFFIFLILIKLLTYTMQISFVSFCVFFIALSLSWVQQLLVQCHYLRAHSYITAVGIAIYWFMYVTVSVKLELLCTCVSHVACPISPCYVCRLQYHLCNTICAHECTVFIYVPCSYISLVNLCLCTAPLANAMECRRVQKNAQREHVGLGA